MKKQLLSLAVVLLAFVATAQTLTVNVPAGGWFSAALGTAGGSTSNTAYLTVTGNIDARDIKYMFDKMSKLTTLNLAAVQIDSYTGIEGPINSSTYYPANEMPQFSFCNPSTFKGKISLMGITLPNGLSSIGDYAFGGCTGLKGNLSIPNSVRYIGDNAFNSCFNFTGNLTIGNSVTFIGKGAFLNCSRFTGSLTIPSSVTYIGNSAFAGCSGFTGSLTIPNSVTTIGSWAFYDCSGFKGTLTISNSVTSIEDRTFNGCRGFSGSLFIPNSVTTIGEKAFESCSGFSNLTIPNSVTSIGNRAFYYTVFLQKIIVAKKIPPSIDADNFFGVSKTMCQLIVPKGSKLAYQSAKYWNEFKNIIEDNNLSTGIDSKTTVKLISISPNPVINILNVEGNDMKKIAIYNLFGTLVVDLNTEGANITEINVSNIKTGIYFVRVTNNNGMAETIKLMKD